MKSSILKSMEFSKPDARGKLLQFMAAAVIVAAGAVGLNHQESPSVRQDSELLTKVDGPLSIIPAEGPVMNQSQASALPSARATSPGDPETTGLDILPQPAVNGATTMNADTLTLDPSRRPPPRRIPTAGEIEESAGVNSGAELLTVNSNPDLMEEQSLSMDSQANTAQARIPLVYQISDAAFQKRFPEVALEVVDSIRNGFEEQLGNGELVPTDPEYARRWSRAEPTALERMRTLFGWAAVVEFERQAAIQAANPQN